VLFIRIDLEVAVTTRAKPLLLTETEISWKPYISRPDKTLAKTPIHTVCSDPDARLINIWLDLREFAKGANLALQTNRKLSPRLFQETLISILYRLLFLSYAEADAQEAFRMLMIHVSTSILFSTQSNNASYSQHEHMLIPALRMMNSFQDTSPKLWLWTAFIARLRQQPPKDYRWLNESMFRRICGVGIAKWDEVRAILKEFIWVDGLYHEAGMRVFDEVMNSRPVSLATGSPSALVPPSA
jgi:hypothetical protein